MAKGVRLTRMRKNTTPMAPPPPMLRAMRNSRKNRAARGEVTRAASRIARASWRRRDAIPCASTRPSGAWVAATIKPPPARWSAMASASVSCEPTSSAVAGSSRIHTGRRRDEKSRQGDAAFLPGRKIADRKIANARQAPLFPAPPLGDSAASDALRASAPRIRDFPMRSAPLSARRHGRRNAPVRPAARRPRRRTSTISPARSGSNPASARRSVDLPAPLRPSTSKASPARNSKSTSLTMAPPAAIDAQAPAAIARLWSAGVLRRAAKYSSRFWRRRGAPFSRAAPQLWFV